jgi:histidine triad (HIT) family protein
MAYDNQNIFARILRGEIPCTKVYETEHTLAFRDINPARPVHVLVIPKGAYVTWNEFATGASSAEQADYVQAIGHVARQEGVADTGYRLIQNNGEDGHQEVPHLHVHLVGGAAAGPMLRRQD